MILYLSVININLDFMMLFKIDWAPNEILFEFGPLTIYWYSVMFIIAFSLGYYIVQKIYINDNKPVDTS